MEKLPKLSGESMIRAATKILGATPKEGCPKPWDAIVIPREGITLGLGPAQPHVIFTGINADTLHVSHRDAQGVQIAHWIEHRP